MIFILNFTKLAELYFTKTNYKHFVSKFYSLLQNQNIMTSLSKNWITEGLIDFEYKKYVLLAYIQEIKQLFQAHKLYPSLSDLLFHYNNLLLIKDNKKLLKESFPQVLSAIELEKLELVYKKIVQDDSMMTELENIVAFALPALKEQIDNGKNIYQAVEEHLSIYPIGLIPLRLDEGYLFLTQNKLQEVQIFFYKLTIFEQLGERYRGIHLRHFASEARSSFMSLEQIKLNLIKKNKKLPNPATYHIDAKANYPLEETLLPVAKRFLVKYLTVSGT